MNITKKIDRAFQWAGEKMGNEARTSYSEDFKMLETEMALRYDGMERLQHSMNTYMKSLSRRCESYEDKDKGIPIDFLGRTMMSHGEDFEPESEFGNSLLAMGRVNEQIAGFQETYVAHATSYWLEGLERSLAMMKEYQSARKKLENRRLAYDASMTKMQKAKREDFRLEDELRTAKAKYEESSEDVLRRMQDVKEAEQDSVRDLTSFLDVELEYHERCAEQLRRVKRDWPGVSAGTNNSNGNGLSRRPTGRSRSNTAHSYSDRTERWASRQDNIYAEEEDDEATPEPVRMPIRSSRIGGGAAAANPDLPARPAIQRASTYGGTFEGPTSRQSTYREAPPPPAMPQDALRKVSSANVGSLRSNLRPVSRINTSSSTGGPGSDVFGDDSSGGSPEYDRSESPATSYGSLSRTTSNTGLAGKKAPPPPPPSRSKKPAPPVPAKRTIGY